MPWIIPVVAAAGSIYSSIASQKGKSGDLPATPQYWTDPNFQNTQDFGSKYYQDILSGNIPDWYKAIGEANPAGIGGAYSEWSQPYLKSMNEINAAKGTGRAGSGITDSGQLQALGNMNAQMQYADYLRAMQGREDMLNFGGSGLADVRNAAYANMGSKNAFDQWGYGADLSKENQLQDRRDMLATQRGTTGMGITKALTSALGGIMGSGASTGFQQPSSLQDYLGLLGGSYSGNNQQAGIEQAQGVNSQYGNINGGSTGGGSTNLIMQLLQSILK